MKSDTYLSPQVIEEMAKYITDAGGNEVLFIGTIDETGLVVSIKRASQGTPTSTPALFPHMEQGDIVLHNHPTGRLMPSTADLQVASQLGNQGIGFYIINNDATDIYVVAEPVIPHEIVNIDAEELGGILEPGGALSNRSPDYEPRPTQVELLKTITQSFNNSKICVAEAGTGIGKSFAYLIPAFKWAEVNKERVVVSTATINLQTQLMEKDIPFVRKLLKSKVKAVLVKGRGNYICHSRLYEYMRETSLFQEHNDQLDAIKEWIETTPNGDRADLSFFPDPMVWGNICSESDTCMGLRCSHREQCFIIKVRKEAASAGVLIVNHHLLFADLSLRMEGIGFDATAVLPPFKHIVFDEAHNIENSATSYFSNQLTRFALTKQMRRLYRQKRGKTMGALPFLQHEHSIDYDFEPVISDIEAILSSMDMLNQKTVIGLMETKNIRITQDNAGNWHQPVFEPLEELHGCFITFFEKIQDFIEYSGLDPEDPNLIELRSIVSRLEGFAQFCHEFTRFDEKPESVFWIETGKTSSGEIYARYQITPINLSSLMSKAVFEPYETVICTSATLSINHQFNYWKSRVGLNFIEEERVVTEIFESPFEYQERVLLGLPADAPLPNEEGYTDYTARFTYKTLQISEGKGLVLFTSYEMLKYVYGLVQPELAKFGITCLKQGDDDRTRLLNSFKQDTASVLFATDSFWEGVDTPGDSLQVVIICRLPFKVPSDPVNAARVEFIERRGGNPFMELSLPEAIIKLKQGFGRLMRRKTDRGIVIILDSRIVKKHYGRMMIESLPHTKQSIKPTRNVLTDLEDFLYN